ncbi:class I adenylate-forming enzyme family protein [Nocardiopsis sp. RSe5-2]|uniref:Class I adenylate-forming enzyme family protein n=1 Tax=Nocardiopsis endophytica TaxID=3018445 RepID=A0ABT4UDU7_9ACTN|nr:class I adenylate-forming enzyme family protein [Nocardiopsis endophytica]MDA2815154.1 class I adenylate-forming enzyme family protein [Nocardiopsis endophytica]
MEQNTQAAPAADPFGNYGYAILTAGALAAPDRMALTYMGERRFTYGELNRAVDRRAHALARAGAVPGRRVAALLTETVAVAEVYLALFKSGAVTAALNPYWEADVLAEVVSRSGATAFVYDAGAEELVRTVRPRLPGIASWIRVGGPAEGDAGTVDLDALGEDVPDTEPPVHGSGDDPLALFYTSGSTGLPKAVVHTHASALATARLWQDIPGGPDGVFGTGAIIWGIGFPAIAGPALYGRMHLVLEQDWGPENFLRVVPREKVTHVSLIPGFFSALLADAEHEKADLSSLTTVVLGGEPIAPALLARIKDRLPQARVYGYYGQTEAPYSVCGRIDDGTWDRRSSGRARTGFAVRVTDPDGRPVVGEAGEVNLAGPHRMAGYDGLPEATAEVLRGVWYVGGDLGVLDAEGNLQVLGRRSDAILKKGVWTQPARVEEAALEVEGVADCGAVGVPENPDGAEAAEQRILLAVVPRAGSAVTPEGVGRELAGRLPEHLRPDAVVVADGLPRTQDASGGPGKLLRRRIRELYGHRAG